MKKITQYKLAISQGDGWQVLLRDAGGMDMRIEEYSYDTFWEAFDQRDELDCAEGIAIIKTTVEAQDEDRDWWRTITRRTTNPKLKWLQAQFDELGIRWRILGETWHAPHMQVQADRWDDAWDVLDPIDDIPDDDKQFSELPDD